MLCQSNKAGSAGLSTLYDLEHPQHRRTCRVHVVEVEFCKDVAHAQNTQKCKENNEQQRSLRTLLDLLKNAGYADVQLHLLIFGCTGDMLKLVSM